DEETFVPPDMPALVDMKKVTRTMGSTSTLTVYLKGDNLLTPDVLKWIDEFGEYETENRNELTSVTSIATLIKQYNGGIIPDTKGKVNEVLTKIPTSGLNSYLNGQMNGVIEFGMLELEVDPAKSLVENVNRDLEWNYP